MYQYPTTVDLNQTKNNKNLEYDEFYITLNAENASYNSSDKSYSYNGLNLNGLISGKESLYNTDEIFIAPVFFFGESVVAENADVYLEARISNLMSKNEIDRTNSNNNALFRCSGEFEQHGVNNHYDYFLSLQDNNNNKYLRIDPSFLNNNDFKINFFNQKNERVGMIFESNQIFIMQFKIVIYRKN